MPDNLIASPHRGRYSRLNRLVINATILWAFLIKSEPMGHVHMRVQIFCLLISLLLSYPIRAEEIAPFRQYLPMGEVTAEAGYVGASPEVEQITEKMAAALKKDRAWFEGYLKDTNPKPGEPLPYHPKLGISEAEYTTLLSSKGKLKLVSLGTAKLKVSGDKEMLVVEVASQKIRKKFVLNVADNTVETNRGKLSKTRAINQTDVHSPTGAWTGVQWENSTQDSGGIIIEKLALGQLREQERGILYYDLKSSKENLATHFVLTYPLTKKIE